MSEPSTSSGQPVELASSGQYYKSGSAQAVLKHIEGEQEAMLVEATGQNFPSILDQILRDLTTTLPVESFDKLLIGDKYHLMFHLRNVSYGDRPYGFHVTCPGCHHPMHTEVDLKKDIEIKHPPEGAEEPFEVELPYCERTAKMRLLRVADEQEMIKFIRKQRRQKRKSLKGDPAYYFTMVRGLLSLDDEEMDLDAAVSWAAQAAGQDTLAIRDAIDEYDVGPELETEFVCEDCHNVWYQRVPLDGDFFRPGVARRRRS